MQGLPVKSWPSCPARFVNKLLKKTAQMFDLSCFLKLSAFRVWRTYPKKEEGTFDILCCRHLRASWWVAPAEEGSLGTEAPFG